MKPLKIETAMPLRSINLWLLERERYSSGKTLMRAILSTLLADNLGVTVIEYAMLGSIVAIVAVAAKASIGTTLSGFFTTVAGGL